MDDIARCEAVCVQWSARFPGDDGASLALARARMRRFYQERNAVDGLGAVELLRGICDRDSQAAKAKRLLAELASRVGAYSFARDVLASLLELIPGEPALEGWYRLMADDAEGSPGITSAIREVELSGKFPGIIGWKPADDDTGSQPVPTAPALEEIAARGARRSFRTRRCRTRGLPARVDGTGSRCDARRWRIVARMLRGLNTIARRSRVAWGSGRSAAASSRTNNARSSWPSAGDCAIAAECSSNGNQQEILDRLGDLVSGPANLGERMREILEILNRSPEVRGSVLLTTDGVVVETCLPDSGRWRGVCGARVPPRGGSQARDPTGRIDRLPSHRPDGHARHAHPGGAGTRVPGSSPSRTLLIWIRSHSDVGKCGAQSDASDRDHGGLIIRVLGQENTLDSLGSAVPGRDVSRLVRG